MNLVKQKNANFPLRISPLRTLAQGMIKKKDELCQINSPLYEIKSAPARAFDKEKERGTLASSSASGLIFNYRRIRSRAFSRFASAFSPCVLQWGCDDDGRVINREYTMDREFVCPIFMKRYTSRNSHSPRVDRRMREIIAENLIYEAALSSGISIKR